MAKGKIIRIEGVTADSRKGKEKRYKYRLVAGNGVVTNCNKTEKEMGPEDLSFFYRQIGNAFNTAPPLVKLQFINEIMKSYGEIEKDDTQVKN